MLKSNPSDMRPKKYFTIVGILFGMMFVYIIWSDQKRIEYEYQLLSKNKEIHYEFTKLINLYNKKQEVEANKIANPENLPIIYCITPSYARPVQKAELTRLSQVLSLVPNAHWIIVEDAPERTTLVTNFLKDSLLLRYTHLFAETQSKYKPKNGPNWSFPRGVIQRNEGLKWLRENCNENDHGIVYFMDDDNTYSVNIFKEMSQIKKVGVWPVGLVGGLMVERPLVDNHTGKVIGFNSAWDLTRKFPIDMAGFAVNLKLILTKPEAVFTYDSKNGHQESDILEHLTTKDELEPLADNCTKIYVWHTRTEKPKLREEEKLLKRGLRSDIGMEV